MTNPMHQELFEFYLLTSVKEKDKRAIRKQINNYFRNIHPTKTWDELTDTERREFKLVTIKKYMIDKILYPDNDKKTRPTKKSLDKANKIEEKISNELRVMHKPLIFIEQHNMEMAILKKQFFNSLASESENKSAYSELCKYHRQFFPSVNPPTYDEWLNNPLTLFDMRENYKSDNDHENSHEQIVPEEIIKQEILEEVIHCILNKLELSVDTDEIRHCLEITRNIDELDYLELSDNSKDIELVSALMKLNNHDFIKEKEG